jgi:hypothetical protein
LNNIQEAENRSLIRPMVPAAIRENYPDENISWNRVGLDTAGAPYFLFFALTDINGQK